MYNNFLKLMGLLLFVASPVFTNAQTEIDTEPNNSSAISTMDTLTLPVNNNATMEHGYDRDYFKLHVPSAGVLIININGIDNSYNEMRALIGIDNYTTGYYEGNRIAPGIGAPLTLEILIKTAGWYYITVQKANQSNPNESAYNLNIYMNLEDGYEYNNQIGEGALAINTPATPLSYDQNNPNLIQGKIRGYNIPCSCANNYGFENLSADIDIYKVKTNGKRGALVMELEDVPPNLKLQIQVVKFDGLISEGKKDADFKGQSFRFELLTQFDTIYYVKISSLDGANGNVNENNSNTSSEPYTLKLWLDTLGNEFNNTAATASTVNFNENLLGKIRGHYIPCSCANNYDFVNLSPDVDYYKPDSCGTFQYARIFDAPEDLRLKLTAYAADGETVIGSKTATLNGDTLRLNANEVNGIPKFFMVEAVNTGDNDYYNNTSPHTYTLYLGYSPYADITSAFDNVCEGVPTNFTAASNIVNNWQWSFGANAVPNSSTAQNPENIVFNTAGSQWVVLNAQACSADSVLIHVNAVPAVPSISSNGLVLTSSSAQGNQWYFNGNLITGATSASYTPAASGNYHVVVTGENGCESASEPFSFTVSAIEHLQGNSLVSVYPNPFNSALYIRNFSGGNPQFILMNPLGQTIMQTQTKSETTQLDLSELSNGIYFLRVDNANGRQVFKIQKQ